MDKKVINDKFTEIFGEQAEATFFSPGRINLIGEHTDYNGGHVFPCAISLGTYGAARKREDNKLRFYSANFEDLGIIETSLDDLKYDKKDNWVNYAKGMIYFLKETGHDVDKGMDIFIEGNIPNGSGLSSSASLEMLIGVIAQELFNLDIDRVDLVKLGMETENKFIGVNSGIMDQFAVGMGKQNQAILLDTNTLEYSYAPVVFGFFVFFFLNTFEENAYLIEDENRLKSARHAVWENQRTMQAQTALEEGDLEKFGRLVNASHVSLEHDYEVTGIELDTLAHTAWKQEGVLGARMTGAGFGGCGIAIVDKDKVEAFKENVGKVYTEKIGYAPAFYIAEIADGTKVL